MDKTHENLSYSCLFICLFNVYVVRLFQIFLYSFLKDLFHYNHCLHTSVTFYHLYKILYTLFTLLFFQNDFVSVLFGKYSVFNIIERINFFFYGESSKLKLLLIKFNSSQKRKLNEKLLSSSFCTFYSEINKTFN